MPIGGAAHDVEIGASADEAFILAQRALRQVGNVKEANAAERQVKGSIRYGLRKILVKAHVEQRESASTVVLKAQGDDLWGAEARKALGRWADALEKERP
jgi:hypothetical protein